MKKCCKNCRYYHGEIDDCRGEEDVENEYCHEYVEARHIIKDGGEAAHE